MSGIAKRMVSALAKRVALPARLGTLIKIAISAGILIFLLARLNPAALLERMTRAQPLWLLLAVALYFLAIFLGVLKWHLLVRVQRLSVSFRDLIAFTFTGLFLGNILPTNIGGDVVRAAMLARAGNATTEAATLSVLVDRMMGLVAFFAAALISAALATMLLTRSAPLETVQVATVIAAAVFAGGAALFFSRRAARVGARIFQFAPLARFRARARRLYDALQLYRAHSAALAANIALSLTILVVATFVWYSVARALDLDIAILYFFLFNPLVGFVLLIPISLNGLGPKEAAAVFFFGLIGVPGESAFALSLFFHAIVVLTSLPGGFLVTRSRPVE